MKKLYTISELENLPTISEGQADDLKIETKNIRIWLSRLTKEDGQPYDNEVTIEEYRNYFDKKHNQFSARWETIKRYKAK